MFDGIDPFSEALRRSDKRSDGAFIVGIVIASLAMISLAAWLALR